MSRSASGSASRIKSGGGEKKDKQNFNGNQHKSMFILLYFVVGFLQ